ncbi:ATP-binding protein [Phenylobacterium montanum]|uniref:histidine kinase n=1 Tax=Phenylobacterium montanum TaxID=2823693 RepID=A0A975G3S2_9CAUL|nr:ATP-binding protein [Caulobacter sp. S6]QUD90598.1 response regulator [Caulobacter sp. S6]
MAAEPSALTLYVLAPRGRDALVIKDLLQAAGLAAEVLTELAASAGRLAHGAGLIIAQEALDPGAFEALRAWLINQPAWSDYPIIFLRTRGAPLTATTQAAIDQLGNAAILERPLHPTTLISTARSAVRMRRRQREAEALLHERERAAETLRVREEEVRALADQLERRVEERTAELAAANRRLLTEMAERERVEATVMRMQRLEAVGQLTAGVAHDFNNLLTVIIGNLGRLERTVGEGEVQRVNMMRLAAERGAKLTAQLLAFSRRQKLEPKPTNLNEAVTSLRDLLQSTLGATIRLEARLEPGVWMAMVDPTQIEMIILNLAINARDAMNGRGGVISVETANATIRRSAGRPEEPVPGEYVVLSVQDTGSGMGPETLARVFEPFFTTKGVGKGSGLGLSQVLGFAKQSGGGVRIETVLGEGTTVQVFFPRARAAAVASSPSLVREGLTGGAVGGTVLLVDDDDQVRATTADMLRRLGLKVIETGSGGAALEVLDSGPSIDLLLLDFAMPGMNGADVARAAQAKRPDLRVLFVTGYADLTAIDHIDEHQVIRKPFGESELARRLAYALSDDGAPAIH